MTTFAEIKHSLTQYEINMLKYLHQPSIFSFISLEI